MLLSRVCFDGKKMLDQACSIWAVENAVAQQRLEGLEPSPAVVADLERAVRGEISVDAVIANIGKRFHNVQILKP